MKINIGKPIELSKPITVSKDMYKKANGYINFGAASRGEFWYCKKTINGIRLLFLFFTKEPPEKFNYYSGYEDLSRSEWEISYNINPNQR